MSGESTTRVVTDAGDDMGPGQRLREAREAARLTIGEVASRMRLEPHIIERLENDDFENLHGPTFVRGYLSGYARLLNLPERPILETYERHGYGPPALVSELGGKSEIHVGDFPVRLTTYVIAGLLVVLVILWWQSRQPPAETPEMARSAGGIGAESPATSPETEAGESEPAARPDAAASSAQVAPTASAEPPGGAEPTAVDPAAEMPVAPAGTDTRAAAPASPTEPMLPAVPPQTAAPDSLSAESVADTGPPPSPTDSVRAEGAQADPAAAPDQTGEDTPAAGADEAAGGAAEQVAEIIASGESDTDAEPEPAPDTSAASPPRPEPLPGSDVLAIQLKRESWIEIYDRGGGRLYYSLAREGSEVVVQGAGPMRVLLGDVEGAAVAYNGEPYDLSRYQGRSVVRFTVGELTSTTPETPAPTPEEPAAPASPEPTARSGERALAVAPDLMSPVPAVEPSNAGTPPAPEPAPAAPRPSSPDS